MIDLDDFIEGITEAVDGELEDADENEDVAPALFVLHDDRCEMMMISEFMDSSVSKAAFFARVLPATLKQFEAEHFCLVNHHWMMDFPNPWTRDQFEAWLNEHPDSDWSTNPIHPPTEILTMVFGSNDGTVVVKSGRIDREGGAPELEEAGWQEERSTWGSNEAQAISGVMIDFAMESLTGKRLITKKTLARAAKALSQNPEIKAMIVEAWASMGFTPEQGMADAISKGDLAYMEMNSKLKEMFPDYETMVATLTQEHLTSAADEYIEGFGVPDGMVVVMDNEGNVEPLASFISDDKLMELFKDQEDEE